MSVWSLKITNLTYTYHDISLIEALQLAKVRGPNRTHHQLHAHCKSQRPQSMTMAYFFQRPLYRGKYMISYDYTQKQSL